MNFSKKIHDIVDQNDKTVKRSQKHDVNLQKNSTLYFQVGLILALLVTYVLFEMQFQTFAPEVSQGTPLDDDGPVYATIFKIKEEPVKQKKQVKQNKRQLIVKDPKVVPNDTRIPIDTGKLFTEIPITGNPVLNPEALKPIIKDSNDKVYSIIGVEQVPIYPGCENLTTNKQRIDCMSSKLDKLVNRRFNTDVVADLGLSGTQRIYVHFKIDKSGNIIEIKARHPHTRVQKEALKVAMKIPKMLPARQSNKNVEVMYSLPIAIKVSY